MTNPSKDLTYFQSQSDFEEFEPYLDIDAEEYEENFPKFEPDFTTAIIVDNIPIIGQEKLVKLTAMLLKLYSHSSSTLEERDIDMPFNLETGLSYGFCFIIFKTSLEAEKAIKKTQGFVLDKKHSLLVSLYSDLSKFENLPEVLEPSTPQPFSARPDPTSWLTDEACRDQFVIRAGNETEISWANLTGELPSTIYDGSREKVGGKYWCDSYVQWSPQGNYLATFHPQGIKLWGSEQFHSQGRYIMPNVEILDYSPCENYMVTYRYDNSSPNLNPAESIIIWDVRFGTKIRCFELKNALDKNFQVQATITETKKASSEDKDSKSVQRVIRGRIESYDTSQGGCFNILEGNVLHKRVPYDKVVPLMDTNRLKWSYDGKYLARLGCDSISIYSLPSMQLLDKKSLAAKDVVDFMWSPSANMISYVSPAVGNHPAIINIISIPDRVDICSRKMFDVTDGRMYWQTDGDYLAVSMTKNQNKKKTHVLLFFRVRESGVPVEQLELSETVLSVSWEPSGDRVAIVHGESRSPSISFYSMSGLPVKQTPKGVKQKQELSHLYTITGVQCNDVIWSPAGVFVALAYFVSDSCIFELHDVANKVKLATRKHDRCNRLLWDPSGRVIASCTITSLQQKAARGQSDDGFNLYTFQGTPIFQAKHEKLFQFQWRPRPKNLLSSEEKKKVIKNIKKYEKIFDKDDRRKKQELYQEMLAERHKIASQFLQLLANKKEARELLKLRRVALRDGYDSDDDRNYIIEVKVEETVVSSKSEVVG
jgi:translation initiation factor 3 subunit B